MKISLLFKTAVFNYNPPNHLTTSCSENISYLNFSFRSDLVEQCLTIFDMYTLYNFILQ